MPALLTAPLVVTEGGDGERLYRWKGQDFPSVTSIIKYGVAKPRLNKWIADKIIDSAITNRETLGKLSERKARKLLTAISDASRNEAADKGTTIHQAAEDYALGKPVDVTPEIEGYVKAFDNFCYDFKPSFLYNEALVVSRTHGYAGTLDTIVEIKGNAYVLDIKTGTYIWPEVALQLVAYSRADFIGDRKSGQETSLPTLHRWGLVLHLQDGTYSLRPVRLGSDVFDAFLASVDMYHWATDLSKGVLLPEWRPNEIVVG